MEFALGHLLLSALLASICVGCPDECGCSFLLQNQLKVDCRRRNLAELPKGIEEEVQTLDVSFNNITRVSEGGILSRLSPLKNLAVLDMSYNRIRNLEVDTFSGNRRLDVLILRGNSLNLPRGRPFLNATFLTRLDISDCSIRHVSTTTFFLTPFLYELDISQNLIRTLDVNSLLNLRSLLVLKLTENQLKCGCELKELRDWMFRKKLNLSQPVYCDDYLWTVVDELNCTKSSEAPALFQHEAIEASVIIGILLTMAAGVLTMLVVMVHYFKYRQNPVRFRQELIEMR